MILLRELDFKGDGKMNNKRLGANMLLLLAAAMILSMESVFGAIGGALLLGESMSSMGYLGCILILGGIFVSQIKFSPKQT